METFLVGPGLEVPFLPPSWPQCTLCFAPLSSLPLAKTGTKFYPDSRQVGWCPVSFYVDLTSAVKANGSFLHLFLSGLFASFPTYYHPSSRLLVFRFCHSERSLFSFFLSVRTSVALLSPSLLKSWFSPGICPWPCFPTARHSLQCRHLLKPGLRL